VAAEQRSVTVRDPDFGDLVLDVAVDGPEDGELVVLLHGFPQSAQAWAEVQRGLAAAGMLTVAPNQRGYSTGARPDDVSAYEIPRLGADVLALADAFGHDRFHMVGHDWGGAVAWWLAASHPERVVSLTAVSTPHPRAFAVAVQSGGGDSDAGDDAEPSDQAQRSGYMELFASDGAVDVLLADDAAALRALFEMSGLDPTRAAPYLALHRDPDTLSAALLWYRAQSLASIAAADVAVPTTYVWSTDDVALGRHAAEATSGFVTGPYRFEVLEGVSHWIPEMAPDAVVDAVMDRVRSVG
jgi:pimeloyl-ACP methyl ester carboxylesterase